MNPNESDRPPWDVYVGECSFGRGVFAARDFAVGDLILVFTGPDLTYEEVVEADPNFVGNPLQVDWDRFIGLEPPGVFSNHSCDPNAGIHNDVELRARRPIAKDEEVFFDYTLSVGDDWHMQCRCGTERCRGLISRFQDLPPDLQQSYLKEGIVQKYLEDWAAENTG